MAVVASKLLSMQVWVQSLFLFALVWSVGANTDEEGRATFDHILRKLLINDPPADLKPYIKVSLRLPGFSVPFCCICLSRMSQMHSLLLVSCMHEQFLNTDIQCCSMTSHIHCTTVHEDMVYINSQAYHIWLQKD